MADTFKAFAEHVTRLATLALHRLGNPGLLTDEAARAPQAPRRSSGRPGRAHPIAASALASSEAAPKRTVV